MGGRRWKSRRRAFLLWSCTFLGGMVSGAGLFLLGQLQVVHAVREQVAHLGFFTRILGRMTFLWRGLDEKLALALAEIPEDYLHHSTLIGRWLTGVGLVGVALVLPWWLRRRWHR